MGVYVYFYNSNLRSADLTSAVVWVIIDMLSVRVTHSCVPLILGLLALLAILCRT